MANQALDGLGNGLFAVVAAAWVTDRLADPRRSGEAQVIVGSCLVFGSAIGPAAASFLVGPARLPGAVSGIGRRSARSRRRSSCFFVPETLERADELRDGRRSSRWPRRRTSRPSRDHERSRGRRSCFPRLAKEGQGGWSRQNQLQFLETFLGLC